MQSKIAIFSRIGCCRNWRPSFANSNVRPKSKSEESIVKLFEKVKDFCKKTEKHKSQYCVNRYLEYLERKEPEQGANIKQIESKDGKMS